jgi:hypothetical protein
MASESTHLRTEGQAAPAFATAWNRLEPEAFLNLLAEDAHYASQWVFSELESREAIADYLRSKMNLVRIDGADDPTARVRAEVGKTAGNRDCVLLTQGGGIKSAVVVFEVADNQIRRYDLCIPELHQFIGSGIYPG